MKRPARVKVEWTTGTCPGRGNGYKLEATYKGHLLEIVGGNVIRKRGDRSFYILYVDGDCIGQAYTKGEAYERFHYVVNTWRS